MFKYICLRSRLSAFTLLEALVSLLVIAGACFLFHALTLLLFQELRYQEYNGTRDWLLFTSHLEQEFQEAHFDAVSDNEIYLDQGGRSQKIAYWPKREEIRKTGGKNQNQGSQTLLFGVTSWQVTQEEKMLHVRLQLKDGKEREWFYRLE